MPKYAHNLAHKGLHVSNCNFDKGFCLYLLSKVINCYDQEPPLVGCWWEGSDNVYFPLGKRPGSTNRLQISWRLVNQRAVFLTAFALLHILSPVLADGRPVISSPDDSDSQSSMTTMHSTNTVVELVHHVFDLFFTYTLQERSGGSSLIQVFTDEDITGDLLCKCFV